MYYFIAGVRKHVTPRIALQAAERAMRHEGFDIYDDSNSGPTVAGRLASKGIILTVMAHDADGGAVATINAFFTSESSKDEARDAVDAVLNRIKNVTLID